MTRQGTRIGGWPGRIGQEGLASKEPSGWQERICGKQAARWKERLLHIWKRMAFTSWRKITGPERRRSTSSGCRAERYSLSRLRPGRRKGRAVPVLRQLGQASRDGSAAAPISICTVRGLTLTELAFDLMSSRFGWRVGRAIRMNRELLDLRSVGSVTHFPIFNIREPGPRGGFGDLVKHAAQGIFL